MMSSSSSASQAQQPSPSQALQCLICGRREAKRTLPSHVAEHLGFWTHNCSQCGFKTTYESEAMDHEGESGHRVEPINFARKAYLDRICRFVYNDCQFADRHGGSLELVLKRQFSLYNDELGDASSSPQLSSTPDLQPHKPQLRERSRSDALASATAGTKDEQQRTPALPGSSSQLTAISSHSSHKNGGNLSAIVENIRQQKLAAEQQLQSRLQQQKTPPGLQQRQCSSVEGEDVHDEDVEFVGVRSQQKQQQNFRQQIPILSKTPPSSLLHQQQQGELAESASPQNAFLLQQQQQQQQQEGSANAKALPPTATATVLSSRQRPNLSSLLSTVASRQPLAATGQAAVSGRVVKQQPPTAAATENSNYSEVASLLASNMALRELMPSSQQQQSLLNRSLAGGGGAASAVGENCYSPSPASSSSSSFQQQQPQPILKLENKYELQDVDLLQQLSGSLAAADGQQGGGGPAETADLLAQLARSYASSAATQQPVKMVWCKKCNTAIRDNSAYKLYHVSSKHLTDLPFYRCRVCLRMWTRSQQKADAMGHIRREHSGDINCLEDNYSQCTYKCREIYPQLFREMGSGHRRWRRRRTANPGGPV